MEFWQWFLLFMIYVPLLIMWGVSLVDVFMRHDLSGWAKGLWVVAFFVVPWLGLLVYLISRPPTVPGALTSQVPSAEAPIPMSNVTQQLEQLAKLRSQNVITEAEYAEAKARVLATNQPTEKAA
jgi:putative oligomerization/nucleic acid binding protein/phospholipase D-like protein